MTDGMIHQLNTSKGGVPKLPIPTATIGGTGIVGDQQDEPTHGGPMKALCLYPLEIIEAFAEQGHPISAGSTGENITTRGVDWSLMVPGARLRLGEQVLIEITSYATPCKKNARWFSDGNIGRLNQRVSPLTSRVYAKVLHGGTLSAGDRIAFVAAGDPTGTVTTGDAAGSE